MSTNILGHTGISVIYAACYTTAGNARTSQWLYPEQFPQRDVLYYCLFNPYTIFQDLENICEAITIFIEARKYSLTSPFSKTRHGYIAVTYTHLYSNADQVYTTYFIYPKPNSYINGKPQLHFHSDCCNVSPLS